MADFIEPVILLGATRSGKSLIGKVLAATGHFAPPSEAVTIWDVGRPWRQKDDVRRPEEATPAVVAEIRKHLAKRLQRSGAERLVDDLPHHTFRIEFCRAVLPEARFILVLRDARQTIPPMRYGWEHRDSIGGVIGRRLGAGRFRLIRLQRLPVAAFRWTRNRIRAQFGQPKMSWGPTAPGQHEFADTHTLVETIAYQWAKMMEYALNGLDHIPPDRILVLRFEDIWDNREKTLRDLSAFCALPLDLLSSAADSVVNPRHNRAQIPLSDNEWSAILPIIEPIQQKLGYDTVPLSADPKHERIGNAAG